MARHPLITFGWLVAFAASLAGDAISSAPPVKVLYLYGDVSENGAIPSLESGPFHQMRITDSGPRGLSLWRQALEEIGCEVQEVYDVEAKLNPKDLALFHVLVLGSNQKRFTKNEQEAVTGWIEAGGGLIAWSDSAFGGHYRKVGLDNTRGRDSDNDLTAQFGLTFLTDNGGGNYMVSDYEEDHFLNDFQRHGGVRFRGEGVSAVRTRPPARMLARLQSGSLGGKLKVNAVDGDYSPETDAALAVAEVGLGRLVGTFDRNTFWNSGEGTKIGDADNREFAQRLVLWAAQREKYWPRQKSPTPAPPSQAIASFHVEAGEDQVIESSGADLSGRVIGLDLAQRGVTLEWKGLSGPAPIEFENNNARALKVRVHFPAKGIYEIALSVNVGATERNDKVRVTVR
ncbi:MAG: DUF4350 domain-containing protein [Candidatus Methylacidiphilales bacterium]|nr:DUF4350 domain-containing protein [Candidatus Methylacidiphilales bacterium]